MAEKPVKVFILCGQSNMSGRGDAKALSEDMSSWLEGLQSRAEACLLKWNNDINFGPGNLACCSYLTNQAITEVGLPSNPNTIPIMTRCILALN
jgi:hypothetical protein